VPRNKKGRYLTARPAAPKLPGFQTRIHAFVMDVAIISSISRSSSHSLLGCSLFDD
jgi:hypothetical protein